MSHDWNDPIFFFFFNLNPQGNIFNGCDYTIESLIITMGLCAHLWKATTIKFYIPYIHHVPENVPWRNSILIQFLHDFKYWF